MTTIGEYAFSSCRDLTSITIPDGLKMIRKSTFSNCDCLKTITIPASVEYVYSEAFSGCYSLQSVVALPVNPPFAYDNSFTKFNIPLYVPDESVASYQTTNPWSQFSSVKPVSGATLQKCATPTISYENKELTFGCETEGVEFSYEIKDNDIKQGNGSQVSLSATYEISVYATKAGYENSDVATATLVWANATFTDTTPEPTAISPATEMAPVPVLIQSNGGIVTVQGAADGTPVSIFTTAGTQAGSAVSQNSCATISTSMQQGDIAIVKIGERSIKVVLK